MTVEKETKTQTGNTNIIEGWNFAFQILIMGALVLSVRQVFEINMFSLCLVIY